MLPAPLSLTVNPPDVAMAPAVRVPVLMLTVVSGVVPPTDAPKLVVPVLDTDRRSAPLTTPLKVVFPAPSLTIRVWASVVIPPTETLLLVVLKIAAVVLGLMLL